MDLKFEDRKENPGTPYVFGLETPLDGARRKYVSRLTVAVIDHVRAIVGDERHDVTGQSESVAEVARETQRVIPPPELHVRHRVSVCSGRREGRGERVAGSENDRGKKQKNKNT